MTFNKFTYSERQVKTYLTNAKKDFAKVLRYRDDAEVCFRFGYDALIKLAVSIFASEGLRVLARAGHHIELINKMSAILKDPLIGKLGNEMREMRNMDMYGGGVILSNKEAKLYF